MGNLKKKVWRNGGLFQKADSSVSLKTGWFWLQIRVYLFFFLCGLPEVCRTKESHWWKLPGCSTSEILCHKTLLEHTVSLSLLHHCLFTLSDLFVMQQGNISVDTPGFCLPPVISHVMSSFSVHFKCRFTHIYHDHILLHNVT